MPGSASGTRGSARLREDLTRVIEAAVLDELAESGYGRFSVGSVVRRAGVGKAAIYRRWPTKQTMIVEVLAPRAVSAADGPDTGSLAGDIRAFAATTRQALSSPRVAATVIDLFAESMRNPELAEALREHVTRPRRARVAHMLQRAVERGELPADTDIDAALDLLSGPFVVRAVIDSQSMDDAWSERITPMLMRALGAAPIRPAGEWVAGAYPPA
jgi:AcrR family transcriptional regulator